MKNFIGDRHLVRVDNLPWRCIDCDAKARKHRDVRHRKTCILRMQLPTHTQGYLF